MYFPPNEFFNIYFPQLKQNKISVGGNHKISPPDEVISETPIVINLWKKIIQFRLGENGMTHRKRCAFPQSWESTFPQSWESTFPTMWERWWENLPTKTIITFDPPNGFRWFFDRKNCHIALYHVSGRKSMLLAV